MRRYPATVLLAIFLFTATLVMTAASLGTVGSGGGDDGDGGSGIGGTGKSGEFGGSGFGGTGGPSPFFTSVDNDTEQNNVIAQEAEAPVLPDVKTDLAQSLEQNVLAQDVAGELASVEDNTQEILEAAPAPAAPIELAEAPAREQVPPARQAQPAEIAITPAPAAEAVTPPDAELVKSSPSTAEQPAPSIINVAAEPAAIPAETMTVAHESEEEESQEAIERSNMPERIQRPDLPPFQRIRPVERPSLLPSRVQPMRI
jgi:hypothetical protein